MRPSLHDSVVDRLVTTAHTFCGLLVFQRLSYTYEYTGAFLPLANGHTERQKRLVTRYPTRYTD